MKAWDAIIIGGGHNGLVNACYLQRAGLDVLVVDKNDWVGGAATSRELTPGFLYSNCSYVCSLFRPEIMRDLELPRFGLQVISYEGGAVFTRDGDYLANYRDHDAHRREFARFSRRDAEAYDRYARDVTRQCRFIQPLLMRTAPDPTSLKPRDLGELLYLGKKFAGLSAEEMALTLRFWTMSISEFLDEYFETDVIKANFALSGIIGTALGPMSPGTAYVLLHHYMGEVDGSVGAWGYARGGMGAVTKALAASFKASGGTIRTGAEVNHVLVNRGKAKGVVLAGGEEIYGKLVVSNADVKRTFLKLVEEKELPDIFLRRVKNFKIRGSSGKVNIALDSLPEFPALPKDSPVYRGDMHFTDSMERMERAYDDWKAGRWSADPFLDMVIPTTLDPTMASPGKHFMSCFVQYCATQGERPRMDRCRPRWFRRKRDCADRRILAGFPRPHHPHGSAHAARDRGRGWPHRGQHFPGRTDLRSAPVQPPRAGLRAVPLAGWRPLYVRLLHPPWRRRHGRARPQCRSRNPARSCQIPLAYEPGP